MPNQTTIDTVMNNRMAKARAARNSKSANPADLIDALEVGDSYGFTRVVAFGDMLDPEEEINQIMSALRDKASPYIARAKDADGLDERVFYTTSGKFLSDDGKKVVFVVAVKRSR